jgi:benzoyl-CoA reductase/2-hydroxyglutaryl-CoA dehydratase subunit BcrC/BadD/HgdB
VLKWYEVQARFYNVPLFILDTPICHTRYSPEIAKYVQAQIDEYIAFLEKVTKRKFNYEKMAEVGRLAFEAQLLWQKVLNTTAHKPSPMSAFDAFFFLALIVTLRGTKIAVDFYKELLGEMEQRIKDGISMVPNEKYRLLWDNLPVWYQLKWLSQKFSDHNACLVADTYTSAWCGAIQYTNKDNFIGSIAEAYTRIYLNIGVDQMAGQVLDMIKFYNADGLVMHSNRSCKPYSFGQMDIMKIVREKTNLPVLMIEADMVDPRNFSQSQVETRIDAFMEIIQQRND